jgi:hypothetical protein
VALVDFDSNALVELVLDEVGSDIAAELWNARDARCRVDWPLPRSAQRSQLPSAATT